MYQITYSYYSSSSSSSSSSSINNHPPKTTKPSRPSYIDSLHSVRKPTQKPMITKQFIAPLPPTPTKVYKVSCSNFKQVVRMLTSTPEFQSPPVRRLKDIAPPPLTLSSIPKPTIMPKSQQAPPPTKFIAKSHIMDYFESLSPLGSILSPAPPSFDPFGATLISPLGFMSPSSLAWCSSLLLSPTNLSGFNQSPIL